VQLYDGFGSLYELSARVMPGEPAIAAGERVVLCRYDEGGGAYFAVQDDVIQEAAPLGRRDVERSAR